MAETKPDTQAKPMPYKKDDFVSGQDVRWCPGCGDYSILSMMQRTLSQFDTPRENYVFVSGIGCSSRFPYYMNTYGYHTIHGRAPTIASGIKCANPDLKVCVITGDGDGLSIGGNHLIHALRRNMDLNIFLVNNRIYGLTKGQYSPTSELGKITKSTPFGSIEHPVNALCLAIASEATFVARTLDTDPKHMGEIFQRALSHKGVSFVEIYQNCIIFNDKAHGPVTGRDTRDDRMVYLQDGKPLVFGKSKEKAIRIKRLHTEVIEIAEAEKNKIELLVHHENDTDPTAAYLLTQMNYPEKPVPFGVFRCLEKPTYDDMLHQQVRKAHEDKGEGELKKLIYGNETWTVKEEKRVEHHEPKEIAPTTPEVPTEEIIKLKKGETIQKVIMTAPISDLVTGEDLLVCRSGDSVKTVVQLFQEKNKNCILVSLDGKLVGIVSYRDLLRKVAGQNVDLDEVKVEEVMTKNPETVKPEDRINVVVNKMSMGGFRHIPVMDKDRKPISIISIKDVLSYLDKRD